MRNPSLEEEVIADVPFAGISEADAACRSRHGTGRCINSNSIRKSGERWRPGAKRLHPPLHGDHIRAGGLRSVENNSDRRHNAGSSRLNETGQQREGTGRLGRARPTVVMVSRNRISIRVQLDGQRAIGRADDDGRTFGNALQVRHPPAPGDASLTASASSISHAERRTKLPPIHQAVHAASKAEKSEGSRGNRVTVFHAEVTLQGFRTGGFPATSSSLPVGRLSARPLHLPKDSDARCDLGRRPWPG